MKARKQSIQAFKSAEKDNARRKVLSVVKDAPGITRQEIAEVLSWPINRVCPRVVELMERNLIFETGEYQVVFFPNKRTRRSKLKAV